MEDIKYLNNLIIFNENGEILFMSGDSSGYISRPSVNNLDFIEIPYGTIDYSKNRILKIDVVSKKPILEEIVTELTEDEKRVQALEKQNADLAYQLLINEGGK